jgi:hypothetical protein
MVQDQEDFRDNLVKFAEVVELLEKTIAKNGDVNISIVLNENNFKYVSQNLSNKLNDNKCIISIGSVDFTFLKM